MATIDPKLLIGVALFLPIFYIWIDWSFSVIFLAGLAGYAWFKLDNEFIHKSEERRRDAPQVGPSQPFLPPDREWNIDEAGEPVAKYQPPPPQYPPQRQGR